MKKLFLSIFIISFTLATKAQSQNKTLVLELFTSQGCSSCPRADTALDNVKNIYSKNDVIILSYHVDYWNYIGWKDPFSNKKFTKKQQSYNIKFGSNRNYTPQLVINGERHFVGSDNEKIKNTISEQNTVSTETQITLSKIKKQDSSILFDYQIEDYNETDFLRFVLVIDERTTNIPRGENRNRTLKNSNIVVYEQIINATQSKGSYTIDIPDVVNSEDVLRVIAIIQNKDNDIKNATQKTL